MRARLQAFVPRVDASPNSRIVFWAVLNGLSAISQLVSGEVSCERGIVSVVIVSCYWLLCFWRLAGGRGGSAIGISVLSLRISFLYDGSGVCGIVSSHSAKNGFLRLWPSFAFLTLASFVFLSAFYDCRPVWMSSSTRSHCWRMDRCLWKQWETYVQFLRYAGPQRCLLCLSQMHFVVLKKKGKTVCFLGSIWMYDVFVRRK